LNSLKGLHARLCDIKDYLEKVATGKLPVNHTIIYELQDVFNLLPNLNIEEFFKSVTVVTNDQMMVVYVASLMRAIIALHNLISNKVTNRDAEKDEASKKDEKSKEKEKEKEKEKDKDTKEKEDKSKEKDSSATKK
jgi:26S proteasome regulatory subunit N8